MSSRGLDPNQLVVSVLAESSVASPLWLNPTDKNYLT